MAQESDDVYLLTEVASLYYEENYTQEQIAKVIGVSRSGVSRLLTRSRELGLVDIHVHHPLRTSAPLRDELKEQFGLQGAYVLWSSSPGEPVLARVGALAARYIDRRIQELITSTTKASRTIGVSWGTSMFETLKTLRPRRRFPLNIVQLMGSIDTSSVPDAIPDINGPEIARQFANAYGGRYYYLHAPLLVPDTIVRDGLLKERSLRRSFELMEQMSIALVGIGAASREVSGLFGVGYLAENELQAIQSQGAVGDICGCYFNIHGQVCATEMLSRTIAVSFETLRKVPLVIAVASGVAKAEAILGALRSGVVNVLISDELSVRAVLSCAAHRKFAELSSP